MAVWWGAMGGADIAYGQATFLLFIAVVVSVCLVRPPTSLRAYYAMSGTDIARERAHICRPTRLLCDVRY
eukprot:2330352-Rhodomonas_salina.7